MQLADDRSFRRTVIYIINGFASLLNIFGYEDSKPKVKIRNNKNSDVENLYNDFVQVGNYIEKAVHDNATDNQGSLEFIDKDQEKSKDHTEPEMMVN